METEQPSARRRFFSKKRNVVLLVVLVLLIAVVVGPYLYPAAPKTPEQVALDRTMAYFAHGYSFTTGLIPNVPGGQVFWIYSDNYLASLAIARYAGQNQTLFDLSAALYYTLVGYASTVSLGGVLSQYSALNSTSASFRCPTDYVLSWSAEGNGSTAGVGETAIKTTINDGSSSCASPAQNYADLLFLQAVYYHRLGNSTGAIAYYHLGAADFDGKGIADAAYTTPGSGSYHQYQTYKTALYLYSAVCLGQQSQDINYPKLEPALMSMQDNSTGGFFTGYGSSLVPLSPSVNTETTALAALALELVASPTGLC